MYLRKFISGIIISFFLFNLAIADSSTSYTIDMSTLNTSGDLTNSTSYVLNDTIVGFVDGNFGYSANYTLGSGLTYLELFCGNGILELGESCDDGNKSSGDGCNSNCRTENVCGNGLLEAGEECDDGNILAGDGCSATCTNEAVCGNGIIEIGETCDDGNLVSGDGCSTSCQPDSPPSGGGGVIFAICGNGVREGSELCDDGNNLNGDGCNSICITEPVTKEEEVKPSAPEADERTIKIKAFPEKRVNAPQNMATTARIWFYDTAQKKTVLTTTVEINNTGWGILSTKRLPEGTYNISLKGLSHLTKVIRNIVIDTGAHTLDFTNGETAYLLAGDVHSTKDNFVNGLDISATVREIYTSNIHADLNKDNIVNGLDISIVVSNLYKYGERIDA